MEDSDSDSHIPQSEMFTTPMEQYPEQPPELIASILSDQKGK